MVDLDRLNELVSETESVEFKCCFLGFLVDVEEWGDQRFVSKRCGVVLCGGE